MGRGTYYNEIDPFAAEWLRNLIKEGLIPDGEVDTRSITDVVPSDLGRFRQHHFFAGIGGWAHALRLAGWPDDRPVWTGSCPCQPFSVAGKGKGTADERHLWPEFHRLIAECRPSIVFGEQVASKAGREWFAGVRADLEDVGYGAAAADLCAAGVGAPHIRQRLYWVATDMEHTPRDRGDGPLWDNQREALREAVGASCGDGNMADTSCVGERKPHDNMRAISRKDARIGLGGRSKRHSVWTDAKWLSGADGKKRRVKPGVCLLANGVSNRVGRLRGYGNAIVPQVAAEFIRAFSYA